MKWWWSSSKVEEGGTEKEEEIEREKLKDGSWHHVATTFDQEYIRLYIDGKKIGEEKRPGRPGGSGSARAYLG